MAVESISVALCAGFLDGSPVTHADFIEKLRLPADDPYEKLSADVGTRTSALVDFFTLRISDFQQDENRWGEFAKLLMARLREIASWLDARSPESIRACTIDSIEVVLFFDMWISSDQMDLDIPPELLAACGRLSIPIRLLSND